MSSADSSSFTHVSVMLPETMHWLNPRPGLVWVDATVGLGGHLSELVRLAGQNSTVIGIDQDEEALSAARIRLKESGLMHDNIHLVHGNFCDIEQILSERGIEHITGGILADIGVSSMQLDNLERGFSFLNDGPLDMRMDKKNSVTAGTLVNTLTEAELADILYRYGEERLSRRIAKRIVAARPITSTRELSLLVCAAIGRGKHEDRIHPATRTFQALRIAVNNELSALEKFLHGSIKKLATGARIVVISFHSLEDRLVKQVFKEYDTACICPPKFPICMCSKKKELKILTNKPLQPSNIETLANPRSRSAKLRAGERLISE